MKIYEHLQIENSSYQSQKDMFPVILFLFASHFQCCNTLDLIDE